MSDASELYERDFYAWPWKQAALLRAWPEKLHPNALGPLIDLGHPGLVLPVIAGFLGLSLLCAGGAQGMARAARAPQAVPAE